VPLSAAAAVTAASPRSCELEGSYHSFKIEKIAIRVQERSMHS